MSLYLSLNLNLNLSLSLSLSSLLLLELELLDLQFQVVPGRPDHVGGHQGGLLGGQGAGHNAASIPHSSGAPAEGNDLPGHGEEDPDELLSGEAIAAGAGGQEVGRGEVGELRGHQLPQGVQLAGDAEVLLGGGAGGGEGGGDVGACVLQVGLEDGGGLGGATGVLGGGRDDRGRDILGDVVGGLGEGERVILGEIL